MNRASPVTRWQALAVFLLTVFVSVLLAWRIELQQQHLEQQQDEIIANQEQIQQNAERITDARYGSCLGGQRIITRFNEMLDQLAEVDKMNKGISDTVRAKRIEIYKRGIVPIPRCQR